MCERYLGLTKRLFDRILLNNCMMLKRVLDTVYTGEMLSEGFIKAIGRTKIEKSKGLNVLPNHLS